LAVTRGGHTVTLQQEPEHKPVRDQEKRHQDRHDEVGSAQLAWLVPNAIALIEGVEEIRAAPDVERPDQGDYRRKREAARRAGSGERPVR
jgi:hypothetical protein